MGRRLNRSAALGLTTLVALVVGVPVGIAGAADALTLTTPYPAVAVAPGTKVSFDLTIQTTTSERVDLAVKGTPTDWTASLFGGGFIVDGVLTTANKPTSVRLDVSVPATATATTARIDVVATVPRSASSPGAATILPLDIRVTPQAAGDVSLTTDFPQLKGPSTATFKFNLTLHNDTSEDLPFTGTATGPAGWTVTAQVSSESQAASAIVKAGATSPVTVTATAPQNVAAGVNPIAVDVTSGDRTAHADLAAEVTGTYAIKLTTPDGVLSTQATAGSNTDLSLVVQNDGTADVTGVQLSATAPKGWKLTFEPATTDVAAGQTSTVIAHMTPSGDAIAGDYAVTLKATSDQASDSADIRVTIQTGLLGGVLGIGLIVLVIAGLGWVFLRYGRR
jgi:uncharacterized membrane protein